LDLSKAIVADHVHVDAVLALLLLGHLLEAQGWPRSIDQDRRIGVGCVTERREAFDLGVVVGPDFVAIEDCCPEARQAGSARAIEDDFSQC